jgi:hypothetical protein
MSIKRFLIILLAYGILPVYVSGQSADDIISKYIQAIGGEEIVKGVKSIYTESSAKIFGIRCTTLNTTMNGKGSLTESKYLVTRQISCYNEHSGWTSNGKKADDMPNDQYEAGREQIYIGFPFLDYKTRGYKAELSGKEKVNDLNTYKISMIRTNDNLTDYWFDTSTGYLIKLKHKMIMQGKNVEVEMKYSDYRKTSTGYSIPMVVETNISGMFSLTNRISKVIINQPVDLKIFDKPAVNPNP